MIKFETSFKTIKSIHEPMDWKFYYMEFPPLPQKDLGPFDYEEYKSTLSRAEEGKLQAKATRNLLAILVDNDIDFQKRKEKFKYSSFQNLKTMQKYASDLVHRKLDMTPICPCCDEVEPRLISKLIPFLKCEALTEDSDDVQDATHLIYKTAVIYF